MKIKYFNLKQILLRSILPLGQIQNTSSFFRLIKSNTISLPSLCNVKTLDNSIWLTFGLMSAFFFMFVFFFYVWEYLYIFTGCPYRHLIIMFLVLLGNLGAWKQYKISKSDEKDSCQNLLKNVFSWILLFILIYCINLLLIH